MRIVRAVAALVCSAALLTACSGDDEPTAAEKFCAEYKSFYDASTAGQGGADAEALQRMKAFAASAKKLDLPDEMSADAQAGLKTWISFMEDLPDDATQQDAAALEQEFSAADLDQIDAFYLFGNRNCIFDPPADSKN